MTSSLPEPFCNALVLTGPTCSGKSQLGIDLAQKLGAEIISMDSMALYRGMDIGTAKPQAAQRSIVPHHLIDVLDPWESASVAWWLDQAAAACRAIEARGHRTLFVGGTPLYLKALLCGLFEGPPADSTVRARLTQIAQSEGALGLHERLRAVDPVSAERLHVNDVRRVIRALEVWELTQRPLSDWQQQWRRHQQTHTPALPRVLWLDGPRTELYARINARVELMFAQGFVEEIRKLNDLPRPLSREAAQAVGYREILAMLNGRATQAETIASIQRRTRQFAKRQMTWLRHMPNCLPVSKELTFTLWGLTIA